MKFNSNQKPQGKPRVTQSEIDTIEELWRSGYQIKEIMDKTGRSHITVGKYISLWPIKQKEKLNKIL